MQSERVAQENRRKAEEFQRKREAAGRKVDSAIKGIKLIGKFWNGGAKKKSWWE